MYQFWAEFMKCLLVVVLALWVITGISLMFATREHLVAAVVVNGVSILILCAANAIDRVRELS